MFILKIIWWIIKGIGRPLGLYKDPEGIGRTYEVDISPRLGVDRKKMLKHWIWCFEDALDTPVQQFEELMETEPYESHEIRIEGVWYHRALKRFEKYPIEDVGWELNGHSDITDQLAAKALKEGVVDKLKLEEQALSREGKFDEAREKKSKWQDIERGRAIPKEMMEMGEFFGITIG